MLAIGVGGMDIAVALAGFPYVMKMPKVVKVNLKGRLRPGTAAKDIILEMLRRTIRRRWTLQRSTAWARSMNMWEKVWKPCPFPNG